jgi:two-component system, chemotaxis family, protein-glutamate methylesterase/glutaminase
VPPPVAPRPSIRVLIVDDSSAVRRMVTKALSGDASIEVVGAEPDGERALARLARDLPDVVILDLEMPGLGGLAVLAEIRERHPQLPVIVFSASTRKGAGATLEALWLGANDCVAKPRSRDAAVAMEQVRRELVPRVRGICGPVGASLRGAAVPLSSPPDPSRPPQPKHAAVEVVVVGASTGGPRALATFFQSLPAALPVPILVVQHMPAFFTRHLADGLRARSGYAIDEARDGLRLEPGRAWLAPGDHHMRAQRSSGAVRLVLDQGPPMNGCRPSLDPLLASVVAEYGAGALAVILTGMGQDGLKGCQELRAAGGAILAQDKETSAVWGMPGAVTRAGIVDAVLPPAMLAEEVARRVARRREARHAA